MANFFPAISDQHRAFIEAQPMFFHATAPEDGRINLSPKGLDSFRVLGPNQVCYLDLTGSSNETAAHLRQNGRITIMFCSFGPKPLIMRLFGTGRVLRAVDAEWAEFDRHFPDIPGKRQIMVIDVDSVETSCGFGVPQMDLVGQRDMIPAWAAKKGPEGVQAYWRDKNLISIDGLPTGLLD